MNVTEGKKKFIEQWGALGSEWGVNRCMAQIHALLLVTPEPLDTDQIMDRLSISRGSTNMNLRALIDWGLVHKKVISGERKDYFVAEKDIWLALKSIIDNRKKKELDPLKKMLEEVAKIEGSDKDSLEFYAVISDIYKYTLKTEQALNIISKLDKNWMNNPIFSLMNK